MILKLNWINKVHEKEYNSKSLAASSHSDETLKLHTLQIPTSWFCISTTESPWCSSGRRDYYLIIRLPVQSPFPGAIVPNSRLTQTVCLDNKIRLRTNNMWPKHRGDGSLPRHAPSLINPLSCPALKCAIALFHLPLSFSLASWLLLSFKRCKFSRGLKIISHMRRVWLFSWKASFAYI